MKRMFGCVLAVFAVSVAGTLLWAASLSSLPRDKNGVPVQHLETLGSADAALDTYIVGAAIDTAKTVVYTGEAVFYGFCFSHAAGGTENYMVFHDSASATVGATVSRVVAERVYLPAADTAKVDCVRFPVPMALQRGLTVKPNAALAAAESVGFFLLAK